MLVNGWPLANQFIFYDTGFDIKDKIFGRAIGRVTMKNKMFPIDISIIGNNALVVRGQNETNLWNLLYGHLSVSRLQLLVKKDVAIDLQKINELDLYEECIYRRQTRIRFQWIIMEVYNLS